MHEKKVNKMFILFLCSLRAMILEACEISKDGVTFAEYYKKKDNAYQMMDPYINVINNIIEKNSLNIKIQKIDCDVCSCPDVQKFPTFNIVKNKEVVDSVVGFKTYNNIAQFISKNTQLDQSIFNSLSSKQSGENTKIIDLEEKDFYSGFDGPWLILFYFAEDKRITNLLHELQNIFKNAIKIGKINHKNSKNLMGRFNIRSYPMIFGIYNGISVPLLDDIDLHNLIKFTNRLLQPSLQKIGVADLPTIVDMLDPGEPIYIVLYKNERQANEQFYNYAHNFKYKVNMYKSKDEELFKKANAYPLNDPDIDKALKFVVYKNGYFFVYDKNISDETSIVEWIFHTHFSNVTKIKNSTFHSVFNGIKPVFLLLTLDDNLLSELDSFSKNIHLGLPYVNMIFSSIDLNDYMMFTTNLLPKIDVPSIVIYNPMNKKFYYKEAKLTKENFKDQASNILKLYENGNLKPYHSGYSIYHYLMILIGVTVLVVGYYSKVCLRKL